jgi:hypothetical protein
MAEKPPQLDLNGLALAAKGGDRAAGEAFVRGVIRLSLNWLKLEGVQNAEDREELAQDVAVRFLARWDGNAQSVPCNPDMLTARDDAVPCFIVYLA